MMLCVINRLGSKHVTHCRSHCTQPSLKFNGSDGKIVEPLLIERKYALKWRHRQKKLFVLWRWDSLLLRRLLLILVSLLLAFLSFSLRRAHQPSRKYELFSQWINGASSKAIYSSEPAIFLLFPHHRFAQQLFDFARQVESSS